LSGNTGSVTKWQRSTTSDFSSGVTDIANTTTTLAGASIGALTITTYFRAVVQSGVCPIANSSIATIIVNSAPAATISYAGSPYCSSAGTATVTQTGTTGGTYSSTAGLSINATTGDVNLGASTPNSYTVTYTIAASGTCPEFQTTASITINAAATVSAGSNQTICAGSTATMAGSFGGSALSATWSTSGTGSFNNNTATAVYTPSGADISLGSVTLTYTTDDPTGPCGSVNASMTLTINPVATVSAGSNQTICAGSTATMAGNFGGGASSATWSTNGTGSFNNNSTTAVYTPSAGDITVGSVILTYTTNDPGGPCGSVNANMTLTISSSANTLAGIAGGAQVCKNMNVGAGAVYSDGSCNVIAKVVPSGVSPVTGMINVCVKIENSIPADGTGEPYIARHYDLTPASNPATSTATITLYATQAEFDAYNAYLTANSLAFRPFPSNPAGNTSVIRVRQYHG